MKILLPLCLLLAAPLAAEKQASVLFPRAARERAAANARQFPWAAEIRKQAVADAERWVRMPDEELWKDVFGPRITRSHMVWSSGYCPHCRRPVPMYDWRIDAWKHPWKVRCPHCNEQFPKNDFAAYHRSGLDERGVFDPRRADRALLFNQEHPRPEDPLHKFGVDDGEGYVEGGNRWRFIGHYLLRGQWAQRIEAGLRNLAKAYAITGDAVYGHKAGVLLDRIADVWPSFDFASQGLVYERPRYGGGMGGYVYYSIDSAYTVAYLAQAYDQIFDGIRADGALVKFLRKRNFAEVQKNIEDNIFRHALANPHNLRTNYPLRERALLMVRTVLDWPANRGELRAELDGIVRQAVGVDGLSGEKGMTVYAALAPQWLADILEVFSVVDTGLIPYLIERHPKLRQTYRFHFDTWINHQYYPQSGDSGDFARKVERYVGLAFRDGDYSFLGRLARATGDPLYWQMAWIGNGQKADGLPHDIFAEDPAGYMAAAKAAVERHGVWPKVESVNKSEWRLAVLRHRTAPDAAVWLDYDSVPECSLKSHYHSDAMNLGLFAKGLDLLPELGYPAVQFGDWDTPQARWTKKAAAHNTVVVDGADQKGGAAESTLWSTGGPVQVIRASSPGQYKGQAYERTLAMVETGAADFYVFDVFVVKGGKEHAKHTHTTFAEPSVFGLNLAAAPSPYDKNTLMRAFQRDARPAPGWGVDWKIVDRFGYLSPGRTVHLRYTDLTPDADAETAETWVVQSTTATTEDWIPTVVARRRSAGGELDSTFVSVLEPYEGHPRARRIRRLDTAGDVRIEVELEGGMTDRLSSGADGVGWERRDAMGRVVFSGSTSGRGR